MAGGLVQGLVVRSIEGTGRQKEPILCWVDVLRTRELPMHHFACPRMQHAAFVVVLLIIIIVFEPR